MLLLCSFLKSDFTLYKGDWVSVGSIPFFSLYDSDSFSHFGHKPVRQKFPEGYRDPYGVSLSSPVSYPE